MTERQVTRADEHIRAFAGSPRYHVTETFVRNCPFCDAPVETIVAEVEHMEDYHPQVIEGRLADSGHHEELRIFRENRARIEASHEHPLAP